MYNHKKETRDSLSPSDALQLLKEGNQRFRTNTRAKRDLLRQLEETSAGQFPFAVVLSCIDSRAPAELIFDQGLGEIFSVRIAGNFINSDILGSLEFACHVAGAKLVVVLGHSRCGAIQGACDGVELEHLTGLLANITPAVEAVSKPQEPALRTSANSEFVAAVAEQNVRRVTAAICNESKVLDALRAAGSIDVVGGIYDVTTGSAEFLTDAS